MFQSLHLAPLYNVTPKLLPFVKHALHLLSCEKNTCADHIHLAAAVSHFPGYILI